MGHAVSPRTWYTIPDRKKDFSRLPQQGASCTTLKLPTSNKGRDPLVISQGSLSAPHTWSECNGRAAIACKQILIRQMPSQPGEHAKRDSVVPRSLLFCEPCRSWAVEGDASNRRKQCERGEEVWTPVDGTCRKGVAFSSRCPPHLQFQRLWGKPLKTEFQARQGCQHATTHLGTHDQPVTSIKRGVSNISPV
jgi:hypothetical protein